MTVRAFFFREKPFDVTGEAYRDEGEIRAVADDSELPGLHPQLLPLVARNESRLDEGRVICDPMEAALLVLAQKGGVKAGVVAASLRRIAELSGVGQGTVNALVYGEPSRGRLPLMQVRPDTQRRLLAVRFQAAAVPAGRRVDATGTRRRLQALATLGWSVTSLATRSELAPRALRRALTSTTVTAQTARAVDRLYAKLRAEPAPHRTPGEQAAAARAKAAAQRAGWRGPLAWDDIDHDPDELDEAAALEQPGSPAARVDVVAVERAMRGEQLPLTALERRDAVARLTSRGLSARCIAELLHTTVRTVTRLRASAREDAA